jgi:LPS-assembly protein
MRRCCILLSTLLLLFPSGVLAADDNLVAAEEKITLVADQQQVEGDIWRGTGRVKISYQDITIQCDEMEYNRVTQDLAARGNIVLDQGPTRFTADEMYFNLGEKTGLFINGVGFVPPMYSFSGETVEKLDATRYRIDRGVFTTCESDDAHPPWSFHVRKAKLEEEGYGRFHSAAMRVQGAPVFYLPYLVWPIKRERSPGLLMPNFGYSQTFGYYFGQPVYVPLGRSYDTTFLVEYFSNGYYGLGNELRWAPVANSEGQLNLYWIWDQIAEEWQWRINGIHTQDEFFGFRMMAAAENLSDVDFFQEFDRTYDETTRRDLYSFIYLTRSRGTYALNLRADRRVTFFQTDDVTLMQLPEVELRVRSTRIGQSSFYWDLISSVNYFDVDRGGDLVGDYFRGDVFPTLAYTMPSPLWLSVTPRVGGRATYYSKRYSEDRTTFEDEPIDRTYVAGGLDIVGPSFSRVFNKPLGPYSRFKHLIEPRIEYVYLDGTEDTSQIPVFDEVDSFRLTNRSRFVLANTLLARSIEGVSARELASFELFQEYSFSDPLQFGTEGTSQWGPLGALLRLVPTVGTGFDAQARYDTLHKRLANTSLAASVRRPFGSLMLTWYQSFNPSTGDRVSSQIRTMIGYRKQGFPFRATVHVAYDIERSELQQQQFQVGWEGSCWNIGVVYRDLRSVARPARDWMIRISLRGIGALPEIRGSLGPGG